MLNYVSDVVALLFCVLLLAAAVRLIVKAVRNNRAPVKTVKATVIDKNKIEAFSKYSGSGKRETYVVVFLAEGKKLSFYVSGYSFDGYRINESGKLKYQGDRLIDFS